MNNPFQSLMTQVIADPFLGNPQPRAPQVKEKSSIYTTTPGVMLRGKEIEGLRANGMSMTDIAARLRIPAGAVRSMASRYRRAVLEAEQVD